MVGMSTPRLKVLSLFSGAGGLDVGLDRVGAYELLACVELESSFCATLRTNRDAGLFGEPSTAVIQADLSTLQPRELMAQLGIEQGSLDVIVGGPPCQSWSTAGRRATVADSRGQLLWDFLRFVDELRPRFFIMENVRGLLSAAVSHRPIADRPDRGGAPLTPEEMPGSAIATWLDDLGNVAGGTYRVDAFEVNAVNYGAPQLRERVLFIGNRENRKVDFPAPTHGLPGTGLLPFSTLADALENLDDTDKTMLDFSPRKKKYLSMVPAGGNWRALPASVAQESMGRAYFAKGGRSGWWRRLSWDLPCPTITTLPNHASTSMCHPEETRVLSVAEFARIQGFPDGWRFAGTPSEQMRQVGNAVPVRLGEVAGQVVARSAQSPCDDGTPATALPSYRRVYLNSHVRTRNWWQDGKAVVRTELDRVAAVRD